MLFDVQFAPSRAVTQVATIVALLIAPFGIALQPARAQAVANLYPPQPPANTAYLRVINTATIAAKVVMPGSIGQDPQTLPHNAVTRLSVVDIAQPLRLSIAGQAALPAFNMTINASSGQVVTLALTHDAQGWHSARVTDRPDRSDGLKATLRAFNFVAGCGARITVGAGGPEVFASLATGEMRSRQINPVAATLVGQCSGATSAPLVLPALNAGDSYSVFVGGDATHPTLLGALDTVAWPPATH